jgi:Ras-related protein Rab-1A
MFINEDFENIIELLLIGDQNVGKSNFIFRFTENKFSESHQATIGIDVKVKNITIDNKVYKVQIFDTSGQEAYKSISRNYYLKVQGILLMFDLTNKFSFQNLENWIKEIYNIRDKVPFMIIGNKCDLENKIEVNDDEVIQFGNKNDASYYKTSAKNGKNVDNAIINFVKQIIDLDITNKDKTYILDGSSIIKEKKKCCHKNL